MNTQAKTRRPPAAKGDENMKRANYFMPVPMIDGLNALADRKGLKAAELVRRAVQTMLKRNGIDV